jgi:hypothetical protein
MTAAAVADSTAREYLRNTDPVLAQTKPSLPKEGVKVAPARTTLIVC